MRTYVPKEGEISREWVVMDAADQVLGRLATEIARILRGKHKPDYTPYLDTGDFVVIVNAERVHLTGAKLDDKGMLPKNRLGRKLLKKLKVYAGPEHPHEAQQPKTHTL